MLDRDAGLRRARAAAVMVMALPGSVYVYQGEELGLHEVYDLPTDVLDDPLWERSGRTRKGRDGCRVPIPWTRLGPSFGFGPDGSWLPQPNDWGDKAVEVQQGSEESTLELYVRAIGLRRHLLQDEPFEWQKSDPGVIAFTRGPVTCLVNLSDHAVGLPSGQVVLASDSVGERLAPDTAVWIVPSAETGPSTPIDAVT
jgi:alpha-glucosidase